MEKAVKIAVLENEVQAGLLESFLKERGIPHLMRSYHDSAYDGLFQVSKGWGCVEAPEKYRSKILELMKHLEEGKENGSGAV